MRASGVSLRGVCLLLAALSSAAPAAPAAAPVPILARDVPLRAELDGGRTHPYRVDLREGEALRAVVEQRGIDVVVALRGPRGGIEVEMDGVSGSRGTEELAWEAAQAGVHFLEVQPRAASAPPGGYTVTVHVSARADEAQRAWISAERLFMEGRRAQASGANLERAAEAYERALAQWRLAGDRTWEGTTLQALGAACLGLGRYDCARSRSEQALALHRAVGNRVGQGATLNNLGTAYREAGQYDRAQAELRAGARHQPRGRGPPGGSGHPQQPRLRPHRAEPVRAGPGALRGRARDLARDQEPRRRSGHAQQPRQRLPGPRPVRAGPLLLRADAVPEPPGRQPEGGRNDPQQPGERRPEAARVRAGPRPLRGGPPDRPRRGRPDGRGERPQQPGRAERKRGARRERARFLRASAGHPPPDAGPRRGGDGAGQPRRRVPPARRRRARARTPHGRAGHRA